MPLLNDPIRLVRTEAARTLSVVPLREFARAERERFEAVLAEWRAGLQETNDDAGAHLAYGLVDANLGQVPQAREEYRTAIRLHPTPIQAVQRGAIGHARTPAGKQRRGGAALPRGNPARAQMGAGAFSWDCCWPKTKTG